MSKPKIIVVGAYGCGNKGDDAILEGFLYTLHPTYDLIPTCGSYGHLEDLFINAPPKMLPCRFNEGFRANMLFGMFKFYILYILALLSSEGVVFGGGSLIHDLTPYNLPFFQILQWTAKRLRRKVVWAGVGVGPLETERGRHLCKKILSASDGAFIRDPIDCNLLKEVGVLQFSSSADMAFAVSTDLKVANNVLLHYHLKEKSYIVVTACEWFRSSGFWDKEREDHSSDIAKLKRLVSRLHIISQKKIVFLPTVYHDYQLGRRLEQDFNPEWFILIDHLYNCKIMASVIAKSYFVFGMRMHSIIFSIRAGIPFICMIYDDKVKHLLHRVGMSEYGVAFEELDVQMLEGLYNSASDQYEIISDKLIDQTRNLSEIVKSDMQSLIVTFQNNS